MTDGAFARLLAGVEQATFSDDKLSIIRATAAKTQTLTVAQVAQLMGTLSMDDDKVEVATLLHARVRDADRGAELADAVTFSSSKARILALFP